MAARLTPQQMARARARARTRAVRALIAEHEDTYRATYLEELEHQLVALGEIPGQLDIGAELQHMAGAA